MSAEREPYEVPKPDRDDQIVTGIRAVASLVPVVSGPALEILNSLFSRPIEMRRDEWMAEVADGLRKLEREGITIETLQDNESFVSTVLHATQAALRTHQAEKRRALSNALVNSARPGAPEDALQHIFVNFVDELTAWHLRLLSLLGNPTRLAALYERFIGRLTNGTMSTVIEGEYPELAGRQRFYAQLLQDLYNRGLLSEEADLPFGGLRGGQHLLPPDAFRIDRTTWLGRQFLSFVAESS
ncbi:MAG: hypothetical protein ACREOC_16680 [Gemmatimonadales bacterium]